MDKTISDLDRMTIGVREWAFTTALNDPWCGCNWEESRLDVHGGKRERTTDELFEVATRLEEFVLRGIGEREIAPSHPSIWTSAEEGVKKID